MERRGDAEAFGRVEGSESVGADAWWRLRPVSGGEEADATLSSLADIGKGDFKYFFFLIEPTGYRSKVQTELERQVSAFGAELGKAGIVVTVYPEEARRTLEDEVLKRNWPDEVKTRMQAETNPFIIVTRLDFGNFDPQYFSWSIIWVSDFRANLEAIPTVLHKLAAMTRKNEDVFDYLKSLNRKQTLHRYIKYFEFMTPGVFGMSVNVKAILEDLID